MHGQNIYGVIFAIVPGYIQCRIIYMTRVLHTKPWQVEEKLECLRLERLFTTNLVRITIRRRDECFKQSYQYSGRWRHTAALCFNTARSPYPNMQSSF